MYVLYAITFPSYGDCACQGDRREAVGVFTTLEKAEAYVKSAKNDPLEFNDFDRRFSMMGDHRRLFRQNSLLASADDYEIKSMGDDPVDPEPLAPAEKSIACFDWEPYKGRDKEVPKDTGKIYIVLASGERVIMGSKTKWHYDCARTVMALNQTYRLTQPVQG